MDEFKEIKFVHQILTDKDIRRNHCQRCKRIFTPNLSGDTGFIMKIDRKFLYRKCNDCGYVIRYSRNYKYTSRNERKKLRN